MGAMKIRKAFKYRLKINDAQKQKMSSFAGSCRFVWNKALSIQRERLDNKQPLLSYNELAAALVQWKSEEATTFLRDAPSQSLQQALRQLDRAFREAFDKKNQKQFPRFKKKGMRDSFCYPQDFQPDESNSRIYLPKISYVGYRKSREIEGIPKNVTVSLHAGAWYVSIQTAQEVEQPIHSKTSMVGIDVGIKHFATLSDGTIYSSRNAYRHYEGGLRYYQRCLSRKQKFSKNWCETKKIIQGIHTKIANIRQDDLHKISNDISKNHAIIVLEDLRIKNMSASASGTRESPSTHLKAKAGLNKSILDQGWGEFARQLEYKQLWKGGRTIFVPPRNTSRACSQCGHTSAENRRTQARFACTVCNYTNNADINAAYNIVAAGHAVLACGEMALSHSVKQEPSMSAAHAA
jgi:putative transposase